VSKITTRRPAGSRGLRRRRPRHRWPAQVTNQGGMLACVPNIGRIPVLFRSDYRFQGELIALVRAQRCDWNPGEPPATEKIFTSALRQPKSVKRDKTPEHRDRQRVVLDDMAGGSLGRAMVEHMEAAATKNGQDGERKIRLLSDGERRGTQRHVDGAVRRLLVARKRHRVNTGLRPEFFS